MPTNSLFRSSTLFLASWLLATTVSAQTDDAAPEQDRWYASLSIGQLVNPDFDKSSVTVSTTPFLIETTGNFDISGEWNWSTTLGKEIGASSNFRVEGEFWGGQIRRNGFEADALSADLDDTMRARALFLNGSLRIVNSRSMNVWIGAGVGAADVRMLKAAGSTCNCLSDARGEGEAYRIKMGFESRLENGGAWFVEIGNVWLPATETDTSLSSYTLHGRLTSAEVRIGYKISF